VRPSIIEDPTIERWERRVTTPGGNAGLYIIYSDSHAASATGSTSRAVPCSGRRLFSAGHRRWWASVRPAVRHSPRNAAEQPTVYPAEAERYGWRCHSCVRTIRLIPLPARPKPRHA